MKYDYSVLFCFVLQSDFKLVSGMFKREFNFCDEVKERVKDPDEYQTFLKCLDIYSTEIVSRAELQNMVIWYTLSAFCFI